MQKEDVGTESDYEKAKGAASDSFKRACFNIGIGRELYSAPFIYIPINKVRMAEKNGRKFVKDNFSVKMIQTSADKVITALEIVNQRSEMVYSYQTSQGVATQVIDAGDEKAQVQRISEGEIRILYAELGRTGVTMQQILKRYGIASIQELDQVTYKRALNGLKRTKNAA